MMNGKTKIFDSHKTSSCVLKYDKYAEIFALISTYPFVILRIRTWSKFLFG